MFKSRTKFLTIMACFSFLLACGTFVFCLDRQQLNGSVNIQYVAPPPTNDLWNADKKIFYKANLNKLLQQISNDTSSSTTNMSKLESLATSITNASQMYSLNGGKYISITLGGREWTATYLSKSKTGDTILTLWSVINSAGTGLGLSSTWSSGWLEEDNENDPYPSNMYGTSFIRAVTLNNGGLYATSGTTSSTVEKDANNKFALFTMEEYGLTKYIVTPRQVSWQEKGQSARDLFEETNYNALNENWSQSLSVDGFSHNVNYAGKTGNDAWADDYIWLPSFSEVGFGTTSPSPNGNKRGYGLWRAGSSQVQAYYQYWFRSGPSGGSVSAYYCYNDASYVGINKVNLDYTSYKHDVYVRPALHLNLTEAVKNAK